MKVRYGHFLIPTFRQAVFIAVLEMPSLAAALWSGRWKNLDTVASSRITGLLVLQASPCPCLRLGQIVFTEGFFVSSNARTSDWLEQLFQTAAELAASGSSILASWNWQGAAAAEILEVPFKVVKGRLRNV